MKVMVIVDCQKDFIDGSLGTPEAQAMIPRLVDKINAEPESTLYVFTRDTHEDNYLATAEGQALPVKHCIKGTAGWEIDSRIAALFANAPVCIDKPTFGSTDLISFLENIYMNIDEEGVDEIEFVGLCTDICVISNALMAKAQFYNTTAISCDATCCAGVTPEKHAAALEVMKSCQIIVKE